VKTVRPIIILLVLSAAAACQSANRVPPLEASGERTTLLFSSGAPAFQLVAPRGYHVRSTMGPDFSVHHLFRSEKSIDEKRGLGIYVGNYPTTFLSQRHDQRQVSTHPATIAGKNVLWSCWRDNPQSYMCETIVSGVLSEPEMIAPTVLHVWVMAPTEEEQAILRGLASSQIVRVNSAP
jgi:hypothetical protein